MVVRLAMVLEEGGWTWDNSRDQVPLQAAERADGKVPMEETDGAQDGGKRQNNGRQ